MSTNYELVRKWTEAVGEGARERPSSLGMAQAEHRELLMREELDELCEELYGDNIPNIVKELCDTLWVVYGTAVALGIPEDMLNKCMGEVYRSNMSKFGPDGRPMRNEVGKVIKGPNYSPANLIDIVSS